VFNFVTGIQNAIHKTELKFLDFIPANVRSMQMEERMIRVADNRGILRNALLSVTGEYDFVILDCPPFLRGLSANALIASDSVLIPVKSGHFALEAVDRLFKYLEWVKEVSRKSIDIEGILITMHEPNTRVSDITIRELTAKYGRHMFATSIPRNSALSEASFYGKPAVLYSANCRGASAYLKLAREILARNVLRAPPLPPTPAQLSRQA
jgi:chromosome partitioning protein